MAWGGAHREVVLAEGGLDEQGLMDGTLQQADHQLALQARPHFQQPQAGIARLGQQPLLPHQAWNSNNMQPGA